METGNPQYDDLLRASVNLIKEAGKLAVEAMSKTKKNEQYTGAFDMVTETDIAIDGFIKGRIARDFPLDIFVSEFSREDTLKSIEASEGAIWIVDPIDGTFNFVNGIPFFSISIAVAIQKEVTLAVVYNPVSSELFTAVKGSGAFRNGIRIHVGHSENLITSLVAVAMEQRDNRWRQQVGDWGQDFANVRGLRAIGSTSLQLCWTAMGRFDLFFEQYINPWEYSAGVLIVKEAGGLVTDTSMNSEFPLMQKADVLAGNKLLVSKLLKNMQHHESERVYPMNDQA